MDKVELALAEGRRMYLKDAEHIYSKALEETEDTLGVSTPRFKVRSQMVTGEEKFIL